MQVVYWKSRGEVGKEKMATVHCARRLVLVPAETCRPLSRGKMRSIPLLLVCTYGCVVLAPVGSHIVLHHSARDALGSKQECAVHSWGEMLREKESQSLCGIICATIRCEQRRCTQEVCSAYCWYSSWDPRAAVQPGSASA